jgi:hypothetical protein
LISRASAAACQHAGVSITGARPSIAKRSLTRVNALGVIVHIAVKHIVKRRELPLLIAG